MTRPNIILVAARSKNNIIGNKGGLPWHLPEDLKRFKRLTVGKPIIMGRKTFESIGKPLPGRHNIVVTRAPDWQHEGVTVAANIAEAIAAAGLNPSARADDIMIIGGGEIYAQSLAFATQLELTDVDVEIAGDTCFPHVNANEWHETFRENHAAVGDMPGYAFVTLMRKKPAEDVHPQRV
jgi:dihydrofolate reductase